MGLVKNIFNVYSHNMTLEDEQTLAIVNEYLLNENP